MRVDLHGLPLSDAKLKSQIAVAEAWESSQPSIELVHGYNLGTVPSYERARIGGKKKVNALKDGMLILFKMIKLFFNK